MQQRSGSEATLAVWDRHAGILLYLLDEIPDEGLAAIPSGSRGRDVSRQLAHLYRVRRGWVHYHRTGKRPKLPRFHKGEGPGKAELRTMLEESGDEVRSCLEEALRGDLEIRMFGKEPLRFLGYLIAHESHHRGQILLALKQNGMRLPDEVAVNGLWGRWFRSR